MMEQGKNVQARRELSSVYLATLKVAAAEPIPFYLTFFPHSPIFPQICWSYLHINSDAAPFEEDFEDDQPLEENEEPDDDDEMADFIVEEDEIDGNGQVVRWGSLCLLQMSSMYIY